jgi:5'-3' exonuclease
MEVHLIDGTYELFRQHFGYARRRKHPTPYDATVGVLTSTLQLLRDGATHVAVASDHVIESFRNDLWSGYKTSAGMDPVLLAQLPVVEDALEAMGVTVWAMVEYEADDALASAALVADREETVERVVIITPDKDLGQCVRGTRVVQYDRRNDKWIDEDGVLAKFGVAPASVPHWLALVGDSADGYPGIPGWGAKTSAAVLASYRTVDAIPDDAADWNVPEVRNQATLASALRENRELAQLFVHLATAVTDIDVGTVKEWEWKGPTGRFARVAEQFGATSLAKRAAEVAARRSG